MSEQKLNISLGVSMAYVITSRPSKKSKLRRLSFLPRIGLTIDFAGKQYGYFQVPIAELLLNMIGRDFTMANIISVSHQQIKELELPNRPEAKKRTSKKPAPRKAQ
jgi:hypothetical protein